MPDDTIIWQMRLPYAPGTTVTEMEIKFVNQGPDEGSQGFHVKFMKRDDSATSDDSNSSDDSGNSSANTKTSDDD